ncbi:leucine-rich repeat and immunoglobulin-like domain-containing nogo receptor-interacting protein 3 [Sycon ciliatum]|uniref:leucine-rich repeat and immunoglobulin-like domain-containing nogo receptor-interacting protein 3 n=1 Tax=Sycon ciliatum TaxID=27933 RepID=UPI0031F69DD5
MAHARLRSPRSSWARNAMQVFEVVLWMSVTGVLVPVSESSTCTQSPNKYNCKSLNLNAIPQDAGSDLKFLNVEHNLISNIGEGDFSSYPQLEELNLKENSLTELGETAFGSIDNLLTL